MKYIIFFVLLSVSTLSWSSDQKNCNQEEKSIKEKLYSRDVLRAAKDLKGCCHYLSKYYLVQGQDSVRYSLQSYVDYLFEINILNEKYYECNAVVGSEIHLFPYAYYDPRKCIAMKYIDASFCDYDHANLVITKKTLGGIYDRYTQLASILQISAASLSRLSTYKEQAHNKKNWAVASKSLYVLAEKVTDFIVALQYKVSKEL